MNDHHHPFDPGAVPPGAVPVGALRTGRPEPSRDGSAGSTGPGGGAAGRPGAVRAASVLGFVQAGFNVFGGITCLQGSSGMAGLGLGRTSLSETLTMLGVLAFGSAALLVVGGLTVLKGRGLVLAAACAVSILLSLWWVIEFDSVSKLQMTALMMAVLPVVALALMFATGARAWLRFDLPASGRSGSTAGVPSPAGIGGAAPAGWLPDPAGRHQLRYWDGHLWTMHVADDGVTGTDAL